MTYVNICTTCIAKIWNNLPNSVVEANTVNSFRPKARLGKF